MASKTANKNARTGSKKVHETTVDRDPIMSCNGGRHAYVIIDGQTIHMATDTPKFIEAVREIEAEDLVGSFAERWPDSAWPAVKVRVDTAPEVDDEEDAA